MSTNEPNHRLDEEYEGLHVNMTEVRPYAKLNDVSTDIEDSIRKADSDRYDKLQQYTNDDVATYTSLSQGKIAAGEHQIYENTETPS
ncbi:hypothetical protein CHS0354_039086 [Potamilus streckersoni]|uniref:Uncharacterized protein n=1 Tax=Potamilus streckersoni TaxID=2493646 RepID=A0AAE0W3M9_9BIVA|nr:hypothetical protein CHS0354_039086 [Potamilus streckersoni]